jgi:large subunit ribosomal protein L22
MEAKAIGRFTRLAPRKARVIATLVRGKNVADALNMLKFTRKSAAPIYGKLLESALANARQKDENVDVDRLYVKVAFADKAPDKNMRRWRPRAMGRATRIQKGMSHITIVLGLREN